MLPLVTYCHTNCYLHSFHALCVIQVLVAKQHPIRQSDCQCSWYIYTSVLPCTHSCTHLLVEDCPCSPLAPNRLLILLHQLLGWDCSAVQCCQTQWQQLPWQQPSCQHRQEPVDYTERQANPCVKYITVHIASPVNTS